MLLQAILGLRADATERRLAVSPTLPGWLPEIRLSNLHVGDACVTLHFHGEGTASTCEVEEQEGELTVVQEAVETQDLDAWGEASASARSAMANAPKPGEGGSSPPGEVAINKKTR